MSRSRKPGDAPLDPLSIVELAENKRKGATVQDEQAYKNLLIEKIKRTAEALRIYDPMAHQEAFHRSVARTLVMRKGNQVGGTTTGAVEIARAVTGQDPHGKYPLTDGIAACLGYGEKHIGKTFYPKLFKEGAFDMIRDRETRNWRTYRPWPMADGGDLERSDEKRPAPPLIPKRFIKEIAWEKRSERIFSVVRFTTGWELWAFNSAGDPGQAQGFACQLYWIDEDLASDGWVAEIIFRLLKHRGFLRWTALPHGKNDEMMRLLDEAEKQAEKPNPTTIVLHATTYDNKYLGSETIAETVEAAKAQGEDVYRQRILGELSLGSVLMYPTFNRRLHDVMHTAIQPSPAQQILMDRAGEPPNDWTRYAIIDPGAQVLAIEFAAVPPPELGDQMFFYDECYLQSPAVPSLAFGDAMETKCRDYVFEAFVIDLHGGRLRGLASGDIPIDKYSDELRNRRIASEQTGHAFRPGCDEVKRREEILRSYLSLQSYGLPRVMIVAAKCPCLVSELERFKKKTVRQGGKDVPIDEGNRRAGTHAVECLEMGVSSNLGYVKPRSKAINEEWIDFVLREDKHREEVRRAKGRAFGGGGFISLGPVGAS